eukprot:scaffold72399_cov22-Prasinocladus_malaysianus.AAC.1
MAAHVYPLATIFSYADVLKRQSFPHDRHVLEAKTQISRLSLPAVYNHRSINPKSDCQEWLDINVYGYVFRRWSSGKICGQCFMCAALLGRPMTNYGETTSGRTQLIQ